jgi:hypothetical protein
MVLKITKKIFRTVCFYGYQKLALKGQQHEIFDLNFFHGSTGLLIHSLNYFHMRMNHEKKQDQKSRATE